MEGIAEQLVATYLTQGGTVFLVPQFSIAGLSKDSEWACPDFVALDFTRREVIVVEVTTSADVSTIVRKALGREEQWFARLRQQLSDTKVVTNWGNDGWRMRFLGFVREKSLKVALKKTAECPDVCFATIEQATFSWNYWEDRKVAGLPR